MIAWFIACGAVVLLIIFFALWRRERALRLDVEQRERWWMDVIALTGGGPEGGEWESAGGFEAGPPGEVKTVPDWAGFKERFGGGGPKSTYSFHSSGKKTIH